MGKSRLLSISIPANQIREFGSSQSLWDVTMFAGIPDIRELKHARFWDALNLTLHNHIHIAKNLFSIRDE